MTGAYDDIIDQSRHVSATRFHMAAIDRAAQFSPFAALSGYGDAIKETARLTNKRIELDEDRKNALSDRLQQIADRINEHPEVVFTYFQPDAKKNGGEYVTVSGAVKRIDVLQRVIMMFDCTGIPFDEIINIEGRMFEPIDLDCMCDSRI
ncbi:MAG TPA: hypothetical protein VN538_08030 [Clostridia bacterium]|nr:hypothetical protein [Clostridia bacterium]